MIISRTPLRISFIGGGTDLPAFYERSPGAVVSTAIDKYIYITVNKKFDEKIRISYSQTEFADKPEALRHELVRESLLLLGIKQGIEITSISDIPSEGTGLGSSSTYTVGLLNALHAFKGEHASAETLAAEACHVELVKCKKPIGVQDQMVAAHGNLNYMEFLPHQVSVEPLIVDKKELEKRFLLFFTGMTRSAEDILKEQAKNTKMNLPKLEKMVSLAREARRMLEHDLFDDFGELLHTNWLLKRQLASHITNNQLDEWYERGRKLGALGGKVLGAGGGGFLLFYAPPELHEIIKQGLAELRFVPFHFESEGSRIIYYGER